MQHGTCWDLHGSEELPSTVNLKLETHCEDIIQVHLGHSGAHNIKDVAADLLVAVGQLVELRAVTLNRDMVCISIHTLVR
jgi:hypothetical protein